jgi:hypothetical protein
MISESSSPTVPSDRLQLPEELAQLQRKLLDALGEAGVQSLLRRLAEPTAPDAEIRHLRAGLAVQNDHLERVLLALLAARHAPKLDRLPVHPWVRSKLRDELRALQQGGDKYPTSVGEYLFEVRRDYAALRRFPAGPFDWVVSGIPRSWLVQARGLAMVKQGWFVLRRMKGFSPMLFLHVAPRPRNRSLVLEKEVMRTYYRVAASLEQQPEMLGIVQASWFLDKRALADMPYLESIHRPVVSAGGLITELGWAPMDSGYLDHHPERAEGAQRGEIRYRIGAGLLPREAALAWMRAHPEYGE